MQRGGAIGPTFFVNKPLETLEDLRGKRFEVKSSLSSCRALARSASNPFLTIVRPSGHADGHFLLQ